MKKFNIKQLDIKKINFKKYILVIVAAIIFASDIYISKNMLVSSFEQCLYAIIKIEGSSSSPVMFALLYIVICFIIICPILLLPVVYLGKKITISIKKKNVQLYPIKNIRAYGITLLVLSIVILLNIVEFFPFIKNTIFSNTELFDDYYVDAGEVDITFPEDKRNLIYIFVESLETSNVSRENGGLFEESIIPNLEKLALDNINFSNNDNLGGAYYSYGTSWTAAAMIAYTSGVPLKVSFDDFNVNSTKFMNVTTIGDILAENGYNSYLLLGSDADFGGRRAYFSNHNYLISDYYTAILNGNIDSDYYEWWGYEDAKLFTYAKDMLEEISNDAKPFNLTILTADTHFTDGYTDKSCDNKYDEPYANSFYCSDSMIGEFIDWVKKQDFYENTTIVIVGDHITMQDGFYEEDSNYNRSIYNVFINAKVDSNYDNKNRVFTTMDMFPTTIASLGGNIEGDRLGLGTNLFSDKKTIPEMMGIDEFNEELMKGSYYYYNYIRK